MKVDWSEENLRQVVEGSNSKRQVLLSLGIKDAETNYKTLNKYLVKYNIHTGHFHSQNHRKGKPALNKQALEAYLTKDSTYPRPALKKRVLKENYLEYSCQLCDNEGEWLGKKLILHLDHINGVNNDNRLENLRFLCPNCHSQTSTYCK